MQKQRRIKESMRNSFQCKDLLQFKNSCTSICWDLISLVRGSWWSCCSI